MPRRAALILAALLGLAVLAPSPALAKRRVRTHRHLISKNRHLSQVGTNNKSSHPVTVERKAEHPARKKTASK